MNSNSVVILVSVLAVARCLSSGIAVGETVPDPVMQITNIPDLPWSSLYYGARFSSAGLLYLWDGSYVWRQNGVNVDNFTQIGEVTDNMADAGPIQFSRDGTQMLLGNGTGGYGPHVGHPEYAGRIFSMPIEGSVVGQPIDDIDYHYDIATLPQQSTIAQADHKYFINYGWEYYVTDPQSWVSVFDADTGSNQVVLANIPGASGAISVDNYGNLYACIGYGATPGLIKRFSVDTVDAAFSSGVPLTWSEGIALNPNNYNNNSAAGMFADARGFIFVGGAAGLTVFRPDGSSGTFDVGRGVYSSVAYNPLNDQVLVMSTDGFTYEPIFKIYEAGDFLPVIPGDANLDGRVDDVDATILATNWNTTATATWGYGDFNSSGTVDEADAAILAAHWRKTTLDMMAAAATASLPEPFSTALLLIGGACAASISALRRMMQRNG